MKVQVNQTTGAVHVSLSKRNLLALLHKVDQDWSAATLMRAGNPEDPSVEPLLLVTAQPDDVHYSDDPIRKAMGTTMMHPDTAAFVNDPPSLEAV